MATRGVACFYCKHSVNISNGYACSLGLDNSIPELSDETAGKEAILVCPEADPKWGFQIGGYYTHMWFELSDGVPPDACLTWHIQSNGEFIKEDGQEHIKFHICDFRQIEEFVKLWGDELRKRGWVE